MNIMQTNLIFFKTENFMKTNKTKNMLKRSLKNTIEEEEVVPLMNIFFTIELAF